MIVHISNLTKTVHVGRLESGNNDLIGQIAVAPGYVQLNSNHGQFALSLNFIVLDHVGDWSLADYTNATALHIYIVELPEGGFRHVTVETN